jgi:hypothetical protein
MKIPQIVNKVYRSLLFLFSLVVLNSCSSDCFIFLNEKGVMFDCRYPVKLNGEFCKCDKGKVLVSKGCVPNEGELIKDLLGQTLLTLRFNSFKDSECGDTIIVGIGNVLEIDSMRSIVIDKLDSLMENSKKLNEEQRKKLLDEFNKPILIK